MFPISAFLPAAVMLFNSQAFGHIHSHPKSATLNHRTEGFVRLTKPVPPPNFEGFPVSDTQTSFKCATSQSEVHLRSGIPDECRRWRDGVYFQLDTTYSYYEFFLILTAVYELSQVLCIPVYIWPSFVEPSGDYIFVSNTLEEDKYCSSQVGRIGGRQIMHLGSPTCMEFGIVQHEFIHALGFFHEQCRPDRDDYVIINWENIIPGNECEFTKFDSTLTFGVPFDFDSVMLYDGYEFTSNNKSTIINKETKLPTQRNFQMSQNDARKLQRMYHCDVDYETVPMADEH